MTNQIHLEAYPGAAADPSQTDTGVAPFVPGQRDSAEVIRHLTQQLDEVRKLNKRLEIMYSALQVEKSRLRYRIVDEMCDLLKRRSIIKRVSRFVLPIARKFRWVIRQRAACR